MHGTKAAIRYARSLYSLAAERNELDAVYQDLFLLGQTIGENRDLALMLQSPIIKSDKKADILNMIFEGKLGLTTMAFLNLITRKRREMHLEEIARQYVRLHLENNNIEEALLITAVPVDEAFKSKIIALVEQHTHHKVVLEVKTDATVLGGFVLRFGDKQIDTSLQRDLQLLRREFDKNLYVKDY